jgi:hypothetical protein
MIDYTMHIQVMEHKKRENGKIIKDVVLRISSISEVSEKLEKLGVSLK